MNRTDRDDFALVVAWLRGSQELAGPIRCRPYRANRVRRRPCSQKFCGRWSTPNVAPVRALPREDGELFIAANNGHVLAFDNLTN